MNSLTLTRRNTHVLKSLCLHFNNFSSKQSSTITTTVEQQSSHTINPTRKDPSHNHHHHHHNYLSSLDLSPLFTTKMSKTHSDYYDIELIDDDSWRVSSSLARSLRGLDCGIEVMGSGSEGFDDKVCDFSAFPANGDPDFDDIDNMRVRGNLFYKLDKDSREFEECRFEFHRRKGSKRKDGGRRNRMSEKVETLSVGKNVKNDNRIGSSVKLENQFRDLAVEGGKGLQVVKNCRARVAHVQVNGCVATSRKPSKKSEDPCLFLSPSEEENPPQIVKGGRVYALLRNIDGCDVADRKKFVRTPTFNQLTAPYHDPFCLDIYISKASVRACVIHRVTSKVVAVAHSISKDMKFDLTSTRNASACVAVGEVLAQRAIADDIYNVVYTPRKGEKLEGKLQIVLQAIIDSGINVKVKLKQKKPRKPALPIPS